MRQKLRALGNAGEYFRRGITPGAILGAVIGLVPGILLILVLGGGQYGVGLVEVSSFIVMSIIAGVVGGALLGGTVAVVLEGTRRALHSLSTRI